MQTTLASDADILKQIEAFCKEREMAITTFGRSAIGDANLVGDLRAGRSMTLKTLRAVLDFMARENAGAGKQAA